MRALRTLIIVVLLLCLVPPASLLAATLIARWAKCELDPNAPVACTAFGSDIGDILFKVADFGFYAVETIPTFVALLAGWIVIEIVRAMGRPKKKPQSKRQTPAPSRNRARGS
ncbi:MAG: hypothetical protein WAN43_07635 [Rhodomicrobium sp.]